MIFAGRGLNDGMGAYITYQLDKNLGRKGEYATCLL
jgi:hypothetical protein